MHNGLDSFREVMTRLLDFAQTTGYDDPKLDPGEKTIMMGANAKSMLMLPLVAHGDTIGLIEVFETKFKREFSNDQIANIYVLAQHAAISLERARLLA